MSRRIVVILACLALLLGVGAGVAIAGAGSWTGDEVNADSAPMRYYVNSLTENTSASVLNGSTDCGYQDGIALHASVFVNGVLINDAAVTTNRESYYQLQVSYNRGSTTPIQVMYLVICMEYDGS